MRRKMLLGLMLGISVLGYGAYDKENTADTVIEKTYATDTARTKDSAASPDLPELEGANGVCEAEDGKMYFFVDGKVDATANGLKYSQGQWYYLKSGMVDSSYNGLCEYSGSDWKIKDGMVDFSANGLMQVKDGERTGWYNFKGGRIVYSDALVKLGSNWWCVRNGKIDFSYSGIGTNSSGDWRVKYGKVDFTANGLIQIKDGEKTGWYSFKGGKVDYKSKTVVKLGSVWWYVADGMVDFSYNGVAYNSAGCWYVKNGKIDFSHSGITQIKTGEETGWFYFKNGKVDTGLNTIEKYGSAWWYFNKGKIDFSYSGIAMYHNQGFYVKSGKVDFGANGLLQTKKGDVGSYELFKNGRLVTTYDSKGWIKKSSRWFYYDNSTQYASGWRRIDGKWYYFALYGSSTQPQGSWIPNNVDEQGSIKGIDVSKWQGDIDWKRVAADEVEFAFVRLGSYDCVLDNHYRQNMEGAIEAGIPTGVYFYSDALNTAQAKKQAQFVVYMLKGYKVSYPVAIDLEDASQVKLSKSELADIARVFCDEIKAAGYTPMIYCNDDWYKNEIDVTRLEDIDFWVARYGNTYNHAVPRSIWQSCATGRYDGISGNVDVDFSYVDYTKVITPRTQALSSYKYVNGYFNSSKTKYYYFDGGYAKSRWENINGVWYWFDESGNAGKYKVVDGISYDYYGNASNRIEQKSGVWSYVVNGKVKTDYTGIGTTGNSDWYVKNGCVDFTAKGLINIKQGVKQGWYYFENGKVIYDKKLVVKLGSVWWYVQDGKVKFDYNGICANSSGEWKITSGKVNFEANGLIQIKDGDKTGWYYFKSGKLQELTTLVKLGNAWWYVESGKVNFGYNGICANSSGEWKVTSGKVDFTANGEIEITDGEKTGKFNFKDGKVQVAK